MKVESFLAPVQRSGHGPRCRLASLLPNLVGRATRFAFSLAVVFGGVLAWGTPVFA